MKSPDQTPDPAFGSGADGGAPNSSAARFDANLRQHVEFAPGPIAGGWERLQSRLAVPPAPPPAPRGRGLRGFAAGLVVGGLLWWGSGQPGPQAPAPAGQRAAAVARAVVTAAGTTGAAAGTTGAAAGTTGAAAGTTGAAAGTGGAVAGTGGAVAGTGGAVAGTGGAVAGTGGAVAGTAGTAPGTLLASSGGLVPLAFAPDTTRLAASGAETVVVPAMWARALAVDTAIRRALRLPVADSGRAERLRALVAEQTRGLAALQAGLDSIKQSLPEAPPALAVAPLDSAAPALPVAYALPAPRSPWAVVGLLETTPSWSILPTAPAGVVDQERTQASFAQSLQLQRQLGARWRVRAGVGQATVQTQARYTSEQTRQTTDFKDDTTFRWRTYNVTIYGPVDTLYQVIKRFDTVVTKTVTVRNEVTKVQQLLRPTYRFWTLPVSAQRLLLSRPRWNLAASAGAQLTLFRDAQLPVWTGAQYELQRLPAGTAGLPRRASLSLSVGLEAQYRLTPRLTALLAPTLRGWVVPPGRGATGGRTLLPAAQVGVMWGL